MTSHSKQSTASGHNHSTSHNQDQSISVKPTQLRRSKRKCALTVSATSAQHVPPTKTKIKSTRTYTENIALILDATDTYLGLQPLTHMLEVPASLRDWIEKLHILASPSELEMMLGDVRKYVDVVLAGLGAITDTESENRMWKLEMVNL